MTAIDRFSLYDIPPGQTTGSPSTQSPRQPEDAVQTLAEETADSSTASRQSDQPARRKGSGGRQENGWREGEQAVKEEGSPNPSQRKERGLTLFLKRQEHVTMVAEESSKVRDENLKKMEGVTRDPALSPEHKFLFAETLREVCNPSPVFVCVGLYVSY